MPGSLTSGLGVWISGVEGTVRVLTVRVQTPSSIAYLLTQVRCSHVVVVFLPYTASGFLVRVASSKEAYLLASAVSQDESDAREKELEQEVREMHDVQKRDRQGGWMSGRREMLQRLHTSWKQRDDVQDDLLENLSLSVQRVLQKAPELVATAVVLGEFTQKGLRRLRAKTVEAEVVMPTGHSALEAYLEFFLKGTGRTPADGPLGAWSREPPLQPEQGYWDDSKWARHFLSIGGFEPSQKGSETRDRDMWLPLHHAIQTTVYWSQGIRVCRGLINMMSSERLGAKTLGGRPVGYTALHLACNGSDRLFKRYIIVEMLLKRKADVNARDNNERTPLHLAAGTGVMEPAKLLVAAKADIHARDCFGKNALDKSYGSSGTMTKYRMGGNLWVRELLV